jgi:raffinose/stachyose/melibiose transport system substrate-binding protein
MHQIAARNGEARRLRGRFALLFTGAAVVIGTLGATFSLTSNAGASQNVTLTVWQNGSLTDSGLGFMTKVAKNFEAAHPGVKIEFVAKPADNYFALLRTALISHTGPDVLQTYPGTYSANLLPFLANLNQYVSYSTIKTLAGNQFFGVKSNPSVNTYALPTVEQYYNGWYNKALFAKAGIKSVPVDFQQMAQDCKIFKAKGITAYADGIQTFVTPGSGAVHDWSYLAGGALSLKQWNSMLNGKIPYTTPALVNAVTAWSQLYKAGCTSKNITTEDASNQFQTGKVAMVFNYSGLYPQYYKALKSNLGVMITPWSITPAHMMIQLPGSGYAVPKSGPNVKLAAAFVAYTVTTASQKLASAGGQVPVIASVPTIGAVSQLVSMANSGKYAIYPMFDNFTPQEVVAQLDNALPQAFTGAESAASALKTLDQAFKSLPASERHSDFNLGQ